MSKLSTDISPKYYYTISFLEGGAVMVIELLGAKIIAPYYGASLYVWSSVLGVTLGGLALGYFLGGFMSGKYNNQRLLFLVILIGAFFATLAPMIAPKIMYWTDSFGVRFGSLISVLLFLSPSLICMGMVSPIIIQLINNKKDEGAGKAAGNVYAISTVGGILATFLFGFYLIPVLGIRASAYITGGILGTIAIVYFLATSQYRYLAGAAMLLFILKIAYSKPNHNTNAKILYNSNGLFGQLMVMDVTQYENSFTNTYRGLYLNGTKQTNTLLGYQPLSLWEYPHKICAISSIKPAGDKVLLLGMGGGSIVHELVNLNFQVDVVELDERIPKIAKKYFDYESKKSNLIIDDARHYIKKSEKKYDVVIFDILRGEAQPSYVFTTEGFDDLKKILNKDALVIVNYQGTMEDGENSLGARSVFRTLQESGFFVKYQEKEEDIINRDVIFIASEKKYDFKTLLENPRYYEWFTINKFQYKDMITEKEVNVSDAYLLTDDKPILELINKPTILAWRNAMMKTTKELVESGMWIY